MSKLEQALHKFAQANGMEVSALPEISYSQDDFRAVKPHYVGGRRQRAQYGRLSGK